MLLIKWLLLVHQNILTLLSFEEFVHALVCSPTIIIDYSLTRGNIKSLTRLRLCRDGNSIHFHFPSSLNLHTI